MKKTGNTVDPKVRETQSYLHFPLADLAGFFEQALLQFAERMVLEEGGALPSSKFADLVMEVAVPLPQEIIDEILVLEEKLLKDPVGMKICADCTSSCHGILNKGDLLRLIISGALTYGFRMLTDVVMANLQLKRNDIKQNDTTRPRQISAEEYFTATKKETIH